jgi:alpha-D-ribose 1-methylphosphonate 5-triphosphate synthase subunit PhnG
MTETRKTWMSVLAKAQGEHLATLMPDLPPHEVLSGPEIGAVMVRGRAGATGAAFNMGEMTVTRCAVRLSCGTVGHAWVQGRSKDHALRAALADALLQTDAAPETQTQVIDVLSSTAVAQRAVRAGKAAATKVDFFTMVRGEDQ